MESATTSLVSRRIAGCPHVSSYPTPVEAYASLPIEGITLILVNASAGLVHVTP
jgi:hypothetical protein